MNDGIIISITVDIYTWYNYDGTISVDKYIDCMEPPCILFPTYGQHYRDPIITPVTDKVVWVYEHEIDYIKKNCV